MDETPQRQSFLRRTVSGTVGAVRGGVENRVTDTAQAVIDDLEPYLAAETVPRIVDALVPHLVEETVPEVVDGLLPHLVEQVVPQVVDGVSEHLAATTAPAVLEQLTPMLADQLLPALLERLRPYLEQELVPAVVDGVTPHIIDTTAPRVVEGLMPRITAEVVPAVLDGMVDDPRIRELVREQSFGLVLDAVERFRRFLAHADDVTERLARRVLPFRRPVEDPVPAPARLPGRTRSHAGMAGRLVGTAVDVVLVAFLAGQGLSAVLSVLGALLGSVPPPVVVALTFVAGLLAPVYLALCWRLAGRTVGGLLAGYAVVGRDGRPLGIVRAGTRALLSLPLAAVWAVGMVASTNDPQRRGLLDRVVGSRTPYRSHRPRQARSAGPALPSAPPLTAVLPRQPGPVTAGAQADPDVR